jgi:glycosyltransferase involved in cell wall biosynthesis
MRDLRFEDPIVVTTVPNAVEYRDLIVDRRVIYYCVDDFALWPGLDAKSVQEMERRLVARAGGIIAVSEALSRRFKEFGKDASVVTHGVDIDLFATVAPREHSRLEHVQKPRVGFFGLIDGRLNWDLLVPLAQRLPNVSFVLAGPVDASAGELPLGSNIHLVGSVPYRELPEFIAGMKALILPYKTGALAKVLSPLKLKEYLATGKPVICAPLEAVREWEDVVGVGGTADEWERLLRRVVDGEQSEQQHCVSERLATESWNVKASAFLELCVDARARDQSLG